MAIPGNWLVGDPGHVDEHNRIYQDLASKEELYSALTNVQYSAPLVLSDIPPNDEGAIWVDMSEDWYPFPQGNSAGDILTIDDPNEKLSVKWIPNSTFPKLDRISVPIFGGSVVEGEVQPHFARGINALEFPNSTEVNPSYSLSAFAIPDNWSYYSIHLHWMNLEPWNTLMEVKWRIKRKPIVTNQQITTDANEADGPDEITGNQYVVRTTQMGGTYTATEDLVAFTLTRLSLEDNSTIRAGVVGLELRREG